MVMHGMNKADEIILLAVATMCLWRRTRSLAICEFWIVAMFPLLRMFAFDGRYKDKKLIRHRYDNAWAIKQIEEGHNSILMRKPYLDADKPGLSRAGKTLPRVITLGGDHTITLPLLRSINKAYGPVTVIHFDSHL